LTGSLIARRPITGVGFYVVELGANLFELVTELVPDTTPIGVLANPSRPSYQAVRRTIEDAARVKLRHLPVLE
jgi:hypothetical protein